MIRFLIAPAVLALAGCAGLAAAGSATGGIGGALMLADRISSSIDSGIGKACAEYQKGRAVAEAIRATGLLPVAATDKIRIVEEYGDAACADPPSGDALSTVIWFGKLTGQLATLAGGGA